MLGRLSARRTTHPAVDGHAASSVERSGAADTPHPQRSPERHAPNSPLPSLVAHTMFAERIAQLQTEEAALVEALRALKQQCAVEALCAGNTPIAADALRSHVEAYADFQSQLDQLISSQFAVVCDWVVQTTSHACVNIKNATKQHQHLAILSRDFLNKENLNGTGKNYVRYAAFAKFMRHAQAMLREASPRQMSLALQQVHRTAQNLRAMVLLSDQAVRSLAAVLRPHAPAGPNDFTHAADGLYRRMGWLSGIDVEVKNAQALERRHGPNERVIRVFAMNHRDGDLDQLALAHLGLPNAIIFGALNLKGHPVFGWTEHGFGQKLASLLADNDHFILLGDKREKALPPIDKMLLLLQQNKADNIVLFPEGQVSLGLMETRPIRENFSQSLLLRLGQEGYRYEVVPLTLHNSGRRLHFQKDLSALALEDDAHTLTLEVHEPISGERVQAICDAAGPQAFNVALRQLWLSTLPTDAEQFLGHARVSSTLAAFAKQAQQHDVAIPFAPTGDTQTASFASLVDSKNDRIAVRIDMVRRAKGSVFLSTFRLSEDPAVLALLGEMAAAARSGVAVRLVCDVTTFGTDDARIDPGYIWALLDAGVQIKVFSPTDIAQQFVRSLDPSGFSGRKLHAKIVIADDLALIGSANTSKSSFSVHQNTNTELDVLYRGAAVPDTQAYCETLWHSDAMQPVTSVLPPVSASARAAAAEVLAQGRLWATDVGLVDPAGPSALTKRLRPVDDIRFVGDPIDRRNHKSAVHAATAAAVRNSHSEINWATCKLQPTQLTGSAIADAVKRGVDVKLLAPPLADIHLENRISLSAAHATGADELRSMGAQVHHYSPGRGFMHVKAATFDDHTSMVGSPGIDASTEHLNVESLVMIEGEALNAQLSAWLAQKRATATSVTVTPDDVTTTAGRFKAIRTRAIMRIRGWV